MPLLVSAIVRLDSTCVDSCPKSDYGDCHDRQCYGCYGAGAYDRRGQSVLLNGLSEAAELELSVDSQVVCFSACFFFFRNKIIFMSQTGCGAINTVYVSDIT
jgi:hypothetical protein